MILAATIFAALAALAMCGCDGTRSLSFAEAEYTTEPGKTFEPKVIIRPKNRSYTLTSSNETLATVENNDVTAEKEGVVELKAVSGNKTAYSTLYIIKKNAAAPFGENLHKKVTISFEIANYEDYGPKTPYSRYLFSTTESAGTEYSPPDEPAIFGYSADCWYFDKDCKKKFTEVLRLEEDFTLYCKIKPRDTEYSVQNGLITGLVYRKLPHAELVLPDEKNGEKIVGIADDAFKGDDTIEKATIPACFKAIGNNAFAGCENLVSVNFEEGKDSELTEIGINAFGKFPPESATDENGAALPETEKYCKKLEKFALPPSVKTVGAFAFWECEKLALKGIPKGLETIEPYAFSGTAITEVDLSRVSTIKEGAFMNCENLRAVKNAENVTVCEKAAFSGTWLEQDSESTFYKTKKAEDALNYADTILFGISPFFGLGGSCNRVKIREETTLIADEAFNIEARFSVDIDTEKAKAALDPASGRRFFNQENLFADLSGVFMIVGKDLLSKYRDKYPGLIKVFAEREEINVPGNKYDVNYGKHILLKTYGEYGDRYCYEQFIPAPNDEILGDLGDNSPQKISIGTGDLEKYNIDEINTNAINGVENLLELELNGLFSIAPFAVSNCPNLKTIDLTNATSPPSICEQSIQFTTVNKDCKIKVNGSDLDVYENDWKEDYPAFFKRLER